MPSHYESFGMATLEGLACGRPVVATSAGGPAYIVEDGASGFLTTPDNHVALAAHFERLLTDDDLRERMGAAAVMRAQHFGWSAVASQILHIYRDTLERTTLGQTLTIQPRAAA
jgi:D-inositol-3-phosphate glycosyltransferase